MEDKSITTWLKAENLTQWLESTIPRIYIRLLMGMKIIVFINKPFDFEEYVIEKACDDDENPPMCATEFLLSSVIELEESPG